MATGISKTKWQGAPHPDSGNGSGSGITGVRLAYEGKKAESEILRTPAAKCRQLWPDSNGLSAVNRLYYGDNLPVLSALAQDPAVCGHVRLVYIDPPYATKSVFQSRNLTDAYMDLLEGAHYLEFLRERLIFIREILADDGSIYVHLDDNMAFLVKAVMDEVFGRANFRNWITRKKCNPKNYTRKTYGNVSDYILFYSKTDNYVWHRPVDPWTEQHSAREYQYAEAVTGRRYKKVPVHAPGVRNGETGRPWRGIAPPPGKHWQYTPRTLDEMDARGEIYWSPTGNPRRKIYLDQSEGVPVQDIWLEYRDAHNQNIEVSGYPTEKNPDLLTRIINASSNVGDMVLDCFSGSGTTLNVASQLGRHWIGVDNSHEAIRATLRRFSKGLEPMGDFASKLETGEKEERPTTLSLFGPEETAASSAKKKARHQAITDFSLIARESKEGDLSEVMEHWLDWHGEGNAMQVAESPAVFGPGKPKKTATRASHRKRPR
ncbi:MAG: site-specific DNA-methyltransferase [Terrimicrobiaceae bacterium]